MIWRRSDSTFSTPRVSNSEIEDNWEIVVPKKRSPGSKMSTLPQTPTPHLSHLGYYRDKVASWL